MTSDELAEAIAYYSLLMDEQRDEMDQAEHRSSIERTLAEARREAEKSRGMGRS